MKTETITRNGWTFDREVLQAIAEDPYEWRSSDDDDENGLLSVPGLAPWGCDDYDYITLNEIETMLEA